MAASDMRLITPPHVNTRTDILRSGGEQPLSPAGMARLTEAAVSGVGFSGPPPINGLSFLLEFAGCNQSQELLIARAACHASPNVIKKGKFIRCHLATKVASFTAFSNISRARSGVIRTYITLRGNMEAV
jgi:hypothetical protein